MAPRRRSLIKGDKTTQVYSGASVVSNCAERSALADRHSPFPMELRDGITRVPGGEGVSSFAFTPEGMSVEGQPGVHEAWPGVLALGLDMPRQPRWLRRLLSPIAVFGPTMVRPDYVEVVVTPRAVGSNRSISLTDRDQWFPYPGVEAVTSLVEILSEVRNLRKLGDVATLRDFEPWWKSRHRLVKLNPDLTHDAVRQFVRERWPN